MSWVHLTYSTNSIPLRVMIISTPRLVSPIDSERTVGYLSSRCSEDLPAHIDLFLLKGNNEESALEEASEGSSELEETYSIISKSLTSVLTQYSLLASPFEEEESLPLSLRLQDMVGSGVPDP